MARTTHRRCHSQIAASVLPFRQIWSSRQQTPWQQVRCGLSLQGQKSSLVQEVVLTPVSQIWQTVAGLRSSCAKNCPPMSQPSQTPAPPVSQTLFVEQHSSGAQQIPSQQNCS